MQVIPTITFQDVIRSRNLNVLVIPGGSGISDLLNDVETVEFVKEICTHSSIRYITSVCTGALLLGASGVLVGKNATTHWQYLDMLKAFHAIPAKSRIVRDGNIITGGGVTAGIDFALELASLLFGKTFAMKIQLAVEYNPQPPFDISLIHSYDKDLCQSAVVDSKEEFTTKIGLIGDGDNDSNEPPHKKRNIQAITNEIISEFDNETRSSVNYTHRTQMVSEASKKLCLL